MLLLFYYCILLFPNNLILKKLFLLLHIRKAHSETSLLKIVSKIWSYAFFGNANLRGHSRTKHVCNDWPIKLYAFSIFDGYFKYWVFYSFSELLWCHQLNLEWCWCVASALVGACFEATFLGSWTCGCSGTAFPCSTWLITCDRRSDKKNWYDFFLFLLVWQSISCLLLESKACSLPCLPAHLALLKL